MTTDVLSPVVPGFVEPDGDDLDQELLCLDSYRVTHDVRSFVLEVPNAQRLAFRAGQHLTVLVQVDGLPMERCYTISSSPTRPERVTLTVKRVPGGPVSNWLHDHLGVGDRLHVRGPLGRFSSGEHPAAKYLFLSAGSGVTPLMSMTRASQDQPGARDVAFVHSARTPDDIIFRDELATMAASGAGLEVTTFCEADAPGETWTGPRGRLSLAALTTAVPDLWEREVFTCGPQPYMDSVREILTTAGVDPDRCHEESFALAGVQPCEPDGEAVLPAGTGFAVQFQRTGKLAHCAPGSTVLDAALQAGVNLPSSCGEGMCGTCMTTLLAGRVDMQHAGGIRPREVSENKILPCCSTPLDDLVVDA